MKSLGKFIIILVNAVLFNQLVNNSTDLSNKSYGIGLNPKIDLDDFYE
jgi:hypothetical protein